MKNAIIRFMRDEKGTEMVEWALIAGLIVVVGAGLFVTIGGDVSSIFTELDTVTGEANTAATAGG